MDIEHNQSGGFAILQTFSTIIWILSIIPFAFASYLLLNCRGINQIWLQVLILVSFQVFPLIGPLGFILFAIFSPICGLQFSPLQGFRRLFS